MVNRQGTEAVVSSPLMLNDPVADYNRDGQAHTIHSRWCDISGRFWSVVDGDSVGFDIVREVVGIDFFDWWTQGAKTGGGGGREVRATRVSSVGFASEIGGGYVVVWFERDTSWNLFRILDRTEATTIHIQLCVFGLSQVILDFYNLFAAVE